MGAGLDESIRGLVDARQLDEDSVGGLVVAMGVPKVEHLLRVVLAGPCGLLFRQQNRFLWCCLIFRAVLVSKLPVVKHSSKKKRQLAYDTFPP